MAHGTCKVEGCGRTGRIHFGMCVGHHARWKKTGDPGSPDVAPVRVKIPEGALCSVPSCGRPAHCQGWCIPHYSRWERHGDVRAGVPIRVRPAEMPAKEPKRPRQVRLCGVANCGRKHYIGGHCAHHHYRIRRYGDVEAKPTQADLIYATRHLPAEDRFWARVDRNGPVPTARPDLGNCWLWRLSLNGNGYGYGYGQTFLFSDIGNLAHRVAWHLCGLTLIESMELDHPCRTPACVRPSHLDQVPQHVNIMRGNGYSARNARKTHCSRGHAYTPTNTDRTKQGHRRCRTCTNGTFRYHEVRQRMDKLDRRLSAAYRLAIAQDPCRYCGAPGVEVEHYFPVSKGGNDCWVNLGMACRTCNRSKGPRCGTWFRLRTGALR